MASIRDGMRGIFDPETGIYDRGLLGMPTGFTDTPTGQGGYWEGTSLGKYNHPGAGVLAPAPAIESTPFTHDPAAPPGPLDVLANVGNPAAREIVDEGGPGSLDETPIDEDVLGDYSGTVSGRDVAKGLTTIGSLAGLPGASLVGLGLKGYDFLSPQVDYSSGIPEEVAAYGNELGPQNDPHAFGGFGISSINLDAMGDEPYSDPHGFGYGFEGLSNAFDDAFGDAGTGFGDVDNETDAATGPGSVGGVGDDEAASTSGGGESDTSDPSGPGDVDDEEDDPEEDEDYAKGGIVKGLLGKDPPGPDDGYGALDKGEYVVRADAVKHYGADFFERLNDRKILKKSARKLLG